MTGPPGETGACGICPDCNEYQIVSLFCSQECFVHGLVSQAMHREFVHESDIENHADQLHIFSPNPDLVLTSS
jgi:hypothetical protein